MISLNQIAVELDGKRQGERQPRLHAARISLHRLAEVAAQLGKILDERADRMVVDAVDARNETQVVGTSQATLERA